MKILPSFLLRTRPGLTATVLREAQRRLDPEKVKSYSLSTRFVALETVDGGGVASKHKSLSKKKLPKLNPVLEEEMKKSSLLKENKRLFNQLLKFSRSSEGVYFFIGAIRHVGSWERLEEVFNTNTTNSPSSSCTSPWSSIDWRTKLFGPILTEVIENDQDVIGYKNSNQKKKQHLLGLEIRTESSPLWDHDRLRKMITDNVNREWNEYVMSSNNSHMLEDHQDLILPRRPTRSDLLPTLFIELFGENLIVAFSPIGLKLTSPRPFVYTKPYADDMRLSNGSSSSLLRPIPTPFRVGKNGELMYNEEIISNNSSSHSTLSSKSLSNSPNPLPTLNSRFDLVETKALSRKTISSPKPIDTDTTIKKPSPPSLREIIFSEWNMSSDLPPYSAAAATEMLWHDIERSNLVWDPFCDSGGVIGTEIAGKALGLEMIKSGII